MANITSAKKRARQAEKLRKHNASIKSGVRTALKKVFSAISNKNKEDAEIFFKAAQSKIDKATTKNIFHKNTTSRYIKKLSNKIKMEFSWFSENLYLQAANHYP